MQLRTEPGKEYTIEDVRVGNTKDNMDMIGDLTLRLADLSATFGRYMKYHIRSHASSSPAPTAQNAFEIMMAA